jgi:predicted aspartyl protease
MRRALVISVAAASLAAPAVAENSRGQSPPTGFSAPILVARQGGQALAVANVKIGGHAYPFIVDSGASVTTIDPRIAIRAHLRRAGRPRTLSGVGCTSQATPMAIKKWSLAGHALPKTVAVTTKLGSKVGGLLGSDVLSKFGKVTVDYRGKQLMLGG